MKSTNAFLVLFFVLTTCSSSKEDHASSLIDPISYPDSFCLTKIDQIFGYDDQGYFDTSFQVQHYGMCGHSNSSSFRISNNNYNCDDTFNIVLDDLGLDSFLNMDISLQRVNYGIIDSTTFKKNLRRAILTMKVQGGESNPAIKGIFSQQGINGMHYGFVDSAFANKMYVYYEASLVLDSLQLGIGCECYAIDCLDKLAGFEKIARSFRLK